MMKHKHRVAPPCITTSILFEAYQRDSFKTNIHLYSNYIYRILKIHNQNRDNSLLYKQSVSMNVSVDDDYHLSNLRLKLCIIKHTPPPLHLSTVSMNPCCLTFGQKVSVKMPTVRRERVRLYDVAKISTHKNNENCFKLI